MAAASESLSCISISELSASIPYPFAALYGRDGDRRSTFISKYIQLLSIEKDTQCIFLFDGHRSLEFAQHHHDTEPFAPFAEDLQLMGLTSADQFDFHALDSWSAAACTDSEKPVIVLEDRSASHHNVLTPLGDYLIYLQTLIGKNVEQGIQTVLVIDNIHAFAHLETQSADDLRFFREEFVQPRVRKHVAIFMAPKLQQLQEVPDLADEVDWLLFADHAPTYLGMKQWQRVYFQPFQMFVDEDAELVSLFDNFREARQREENPEFQAILLRAGTLQIVHVPL